MAYEWKLNASTGDFIARVSRSVRLIRIGHSAPYLYNAENWGDYSRDYPKKSGWYASVKQALAAMPQS
jgi:hypothetical protein